MSMMSTRQNNPMFGLYCTVTILVYRKLVLIAPQLTRKNNICLIRNTVLLQVWVEGEH
jgi:hypothetical protein